MTGADKQPAAPLAPMASIGASGIIGITFVISTTHIREKRLYY